jgi:la-related protein 1
MSSTTFSYAQAAKGHTISQPSPQLTSSSAPPSIKDDVPTANTSVTAPSVTSNEAEARDTDKSTNAETDGTVSKQDVEMASLGGSGSSTASVTEQSVKTGRESEATVVEPPQNAEEKGSRSHSRTSRGNDGPESRKGRKGRKGRPSEKDAQSEQNHEDEKEKEIAKPVLSEAPLPAVNPWTKRLEAKQNAEKAKFALTPPVNGTAGPTQLGQDGKKRPSADAAAVNGGLVNGASGERVPKKTSELAQGIEQTPRRTAPRGSRASDKDDKSSVALPPVADASSWPDPKSAATAVEETTRKVQDRTDATDKEGQDDSSTNKKKNWVNLGIVPTVVFNTPLPPRGAKARGGARGAREAGPSRGGHGAAPTASSPTSGTDRAAAVSGPAGPKPVTARPREGSVQTRATVQPQPALPHLGKHASSEGIPKDQRRPTNANNSEHPQASVPDTSVVSVSAPPCPGRLLDVI